MDNEEVGGLIELLCVVVVGWTNEVTEDTVQLGATGDEAEAEMAELLLCVTGAG